MAGGNRRHGYICEAPMFPGIDRRGWDRRLHAVLNDAEWAEFRDYLDRDRLTERGLVTRLLKAWMKDCQEYYRKLNEGKDAAVGGDEGIC